MCKNNQEAIINPRQRSYKLEHRPRYPQRTLRSYLSLELGKVVRILQIRSQRKGQWARSINLILNRFSKAASFSQGVPRVITCIRIQGIGNRMLDHHSLRTRFTICNNQHTVMAILSWERAKFNNQVSMVTMASKVLLCLGTETVKLTTNNESHWKKLQVTKNTRRHMKELNLVLSTTNPMVQAQTPESIPSPQARMSPLSTTATISSLWLRTTSLGLLQIVAQTVVQTRLVPNRLRSSNKCIIITTNSIDRTNPAQIISGRLSTRHPVSNLTCPLSQGTMVLDLKLNHPPWDLVANSKEVSLKNNSKTKFKNWLKTTKSISAKTKVPKRCTSTSSRF